MPERSPERPPAAPRDDGTRDIRLPPLPDRPAPAVPPEWASYVPAGESPPPTAGPPPQVDEPTDRLGSSPRPGREHTMAFTPPPPLQLLKVSVTPRRRRTSRILWTLFVLILAVIIASGVYLVVTVVQR
jgi:hypothetical protein